MTIDDVEYIMETFPIVRRKEEERFGEYKTKRVILECLQAMLAAVEGKFCYKSILLPPAGTPTEVAVSRG